MGSREVKIVEPRLQPGKRPRAGSPSQTDKGLSERSASPVGQDSARPPSMFSETQFDKLQSIINRINGTEATSNRLLESSPLKSADIDKTIRELESQHSSLVELFGKLELETAVQGHGHPEAMEISYALQTEYDLRKTMRACHDRIKVLKERQNSHPSSEYFLVKAQLSHYRAATHSVIMTLEKTGLSAKKKGTLNGLLERLLEKQTRLERLLETASHSEPTSKTAIQKLKHLPKKLVHSLQQQSVDIDLDSHKHNQAEIANQQKWEISERPIHFQYQNEYHRYTETVTPANKLRLTDEHLPDDLKGQTSDQGIFPTPYETEGISCHSITEAQHAVNMNTTCLRDDSGKVIFQAVRHAVHSPYGLPKGSKERSEGAFRKAQESALAALYLQPEKMQAALQGDEVELLMTSSSTLTPDVFRHAAGKNASDEKAMLQDQIAAFEQLDKIATLPVRLPSGETRELKVRISTIPFNFGVNKFAVGRTAPVTGGWDPSNRTNDNGFKRLIGQLADDSSVHGGEVGKYLDRLQEKEPDHPDIKIIKQLVSQIRRRYNRKEHRTTKGGAAKMTGSIMVLTHLIGGTPLVNCKSAKDRTALATSHAEWLMTKIRQIGRVPDMDAISPTDKRLFMEFALQGNHLKIQEQNSGSPGFKVDREVLASYIDDPDGQDYLRGLSAAVLA